MVGVNSRILMYDGTLKFAQDLVIGDKVMGPDSGPRIVTAISLGESEMFEIQQSCAINYAVNNTHLLSLKKASSSNFSESIMFIRNKRNKPYPNEPLINNIVIKDYIDKANSWKYFFRGYTAGLINFTAQEVPVDPYYLGIWLGDGTSVSTKITSADIEIETWLMNFAEELSFCLKKKKTTHSIAVDYTLIERGKGKNRMYSKLKKLNLVRNKHIPQIYISNSKDIRLKVLAGLLDTDGYYVKHGYDITLANKTLAYDVKRLADSLGYRTNIREKKTTCQNKEFKGIAWRLTIYGNVQEIPVLIERKKYVHNGKRTHKEEGLSSLKVKSVGRGKSVGIEVDGDNLLCLADGTVLFNDKL